jgi:hypothetical protein
MLAMAKIGVTGEALIFPRKGWELIEGEGETVTRDGRQQRNFNSWWYFHRRIMVESPFRRDACARTVQALLVLLVTLLAVVTLVKPLPVLLPIGKRGS